LPLPTLQDDHRSLHEALVHFGLTEREASIYLSLVVNGDSKASELAKELGIHRLDIYNALKSLQAKEMVESILSKPMVYRAASLERVVLSIKKRQKEELRQAGNMITSLENASKKIVQLSGTKRSDNQNQTDKIQILSGKKAIKKRWSTMIRHSRKEILIVATERGATQTLMLSSIGAIHSKIRNGLNVRIFTPINHFNWSRIERIRKEVRHLATSVSAGLCIADRSRALIVVEHSENALGDPEPKAAIMTDSKSIVEMLSTLFFVGWDTSPLFNEVVDTIRSGRPLVQTSAGDIPERPT
jgi:HTH-type transcriptional regulator, sugar sensing transcriptional regulator